MSLSVTTGAKLIFYHDEHVFIKDGFTFAASIDVSGTAELSIGGSGKKEIQLGDYGTIIDGIYIGVEPTITLSASATVSTSAEISTGFHMVLDKESGFDYEFLEPKMDFGSVKIEGKFSLEMDLRPGIGLLGRDAIAGITIKMPIIFTVAVTDEQVLPGAVTRDAAVWHECNKCASVSLTPSFSLSVELKILDDFLKDAAFNREFNVLEYTNYDWVIKWYYSKDYDEFEEGCCPHKRYRVDVTVIDVGEDFTGISVKADSPEKGYYYHNGRPEELDANNCAAMDENGKVTLYLPNGETSLYIVNKDGNIEQSSKKTIEIDSVSSYNVSEPIYSNQYQVIHKYNSDADKYNNQVKLSGTPKYKSTVIVQDSAGNPLKNVNVSIPDSKAFKNTDADGKAEFFLENGSHIVKLHYLYHTKEYQQYLPSTIWVDKKDDSYTITMYRIDDVIPTDHTEPEETTETEKVTEPSGDDMPTAEESLKYLTYEIVDNEYVKITGCDTSVEKITVPDTIEGLPVTSIGDFVLEFAFRGCSLLTSIHIPEGITSIGDFAFCDCSSLTSIHIPDGVTSIGMNAFSGCSSLTSINIPDGVTSIEYSTFENCNSLTSIRIPDGVTSIGESAFSGCSSLTSIYIPVEVPSVGLYAFDECSSLTDIYYAGTKEQWETITFLDSTISDTIVVHYNSTAPATQAHPPVAMSPLAMAEEEPTEPETAVQPSAETEEGQMFSISYNDLKPNRIYNFYALHTDEADPVMTSANVLYLTQFVSGSDGSAEINYNLLYNEDDPVLLAVPADLDIANAYVEIPDLEYTGVSQSVSPVVTLNGVTLTEGTDYTLSGELSASTIGVHTVEITGIGEYTGFSAVNYAIVESTSEISLSLGDLNGDTRVNAMDAAMILVEAATIGSGSETTFTPEQAQIANINNDEAVNAKDAALILVYSALIGAGSFSGTLEEYLLNNE